MRLALAGYVILIVLVSLAAGSLEFLVAQLLLTAAAFAALVVLDEPALLSPTQAAVLVFLWWFGAAPVAMSALDLLVRTPEAARATQQVGLPSLWIAAWGTPLLALGIRAGRALIAAGPLRRGLLPSPAASYPEPVVLSLVLVYGGLSLLLLVMGETITASVDTVNILGGTVTRVWWVGALLSTQTRLTALLASIGAAWLLWGVPGERRHRVTTLAIALFFAYALGTALLSGWKTAIAALVAPFIVCYTRRHQRFPVLPILAAAAAFVLVLEPLVKRGRVLALQEGADTEARVEVFRRLIGTEEGVDAVNSRPADLSIAGLFRDMYPLAGEITRQSTWFSGPLDGETVVEGFQALLPRVLAPDKPDLNMGNVHSRTFGADLGLTEALDVVNNLTPSVPFDVVADYGWMAGLLTFGLLGFLWGLVTCAITGPQSLASHPLTPMLVVLAWGMEAPAAHFLASLRDLPLGLIVVWFVCLVAGRHTRVSGPNSLHSVQPMSAR